MDQQTNQTVSDEQKMEQLEAEIKLYRKRANEEKKKLDAIARAHKKRQKALRAELNMERKKMWQMILENSKNQKDIAVNSVVDIIQN